MFIKTIVYTFDRHMIFFIAKPICGDSFFYDGLNRNVKAFVWVCQTNSIFWERAREKNNNNNQPQ